mgnify:CR=1 FL=1
MANPLSVIKAIGEAGKAVSKARKAKKTKAALPLSVFSKPSVEPVVTQAGKLGIPIGSVEQMNVAHPSKFGPYATITPRIAQKDVRVGYEPMARMETGRTLSPETLENSLVVPLLGDRSIAGKRIVSVNDAPVDVSTYGGPNYAVFNKAMGSGAGWASEKSQISALQNKIRKGLEQGRNVYGVHIAMSPRSADQSTMMTDLLLQQIQKSDIQKNSVKEFDELIRKYIPDFPGVMHPDAQKTLENVTQKKRKKLVEQMDTAKFLKAGFPDVSAARMAITEPELLHVPAGGSGFSVVKFTPKSLEPMEITLPHPTYPTQMAGEPMSGLSHLIPFDMLLPDLIAQRRAANLPAGKDLRAVEFSKPSQVMRAENIDNIMTYLEKLNSTK